MMIIQNTSNVSQAPMPIPRQGGDAPKGVSNASNASATPDITGASPQTAPAQGVAKQPSPEELKKAVDVINQVMKQSNNSLEFSVDNETKLPVVKMVDSSTGELIRQYPSEETLAISRDIAQFQQGQLLKQKA